MNFWANFAKNADPGISLNNISWTKFDPNSSKSILLIDEKKNLKISKLDLSLDSLVEDIINTKILTDEEKCIILYETTNYIGDDFFELYSDKLNYDCSRNEALRISEKNGGYIKL